MDNTLEMELTKKQLMRLKLYVNGLSYSEIAQIENTSKTAIYKSIQQCKELIKKYT